MEKQFYVYTLASAPRGALYIGVTNDLCRRVWEHKEGVADGYTKRYWIKRLVYYETLDSADAAIAREKKLKRWRRAWKYDLIEAGNRDWRDLYTDIAGP
jgi:putative endonuclease